MTTTLKKLYRSKSDRFVGGVCGGVSEFFELDSTLVRVLFVVFTIFWGIGILVYLVALFLVPENPDDTAESVDRDFSANNPLIWGTIFFSLGALLLFRELDLDYIFDFDIPWRMVWAIFLIGVGSAIFYASQQAGDKPSSTDIATESDIEADATEAEAKTFPHFHFHRSVTDRKLAGVCAGIATHFNIDPSIIRICWVLGTLASKGLGALIYLAFVFIFPEEEPRNEQIV